MRRNIRLVGVYFALLFMLFMCFFTLIYPIVPFWGDDWVLLSAYGSLKPVAYSWIPARLLPPYIHTGIGIFSVYVLMPLFGLDFVDSLTLGSALVLSTGLCVLCFCVYCLLGAITQSRVLGLFLTSIFVVGGFCATKASVMPLFLPADLEAEGMGYILTLIGFYILPNALNLCLLCLVVYLQAVRMGLAKAPQFMQKPSSSLYLLAGGGGITLLYLAQFSITSASLLLACFCGVSLCIELLLFILFKRAKMGFGHFLLYDLGLYGLICFICVILWIVAAYYDMHSGRAEYCGSFSLSFGVGYMYKSLKILRDGFYALFAMVVALAIYRAYVYKPLRDIVWMILSYLVCLICLYTLLVSKCGAKYYLMSGLMLCFLWAMCLLLALVLMSYAKRDASPLAGVRDGNSGRVSSDSKRDASVAPAPARADNNPSISSGNSSVVGASTKGDDTLLIPPKVLVLLSFMAFFAFLHPFEPYKERPRSAYLYHREYAKSWVKEAQVAAESGKQSLSIVIPAKFPHWRWEGWFFEGFAHTLKHYGIIDKPLKVRFEADTPLN